MLNGPKEGNQSLPEVVIRVAVPSDAESIARVHIDAWRSTYKGILPEEYLAKLSYEKGTRRWEANLGGEEKLPFVYVAERAGEVVGFASGGPEGEGHAVFDGALYGIYVLDSHQRRGIGRRLVRAIAGDLMRCGFSAALVWVLEDNPYRAFYEALGGELVATKEAEVGGLRVVEVAYGWTSLHQLAERCVGRTAGS